MAHRKEISTALWKRIHPLIPVVPPSPKGGRPRVDDQSALNGIVYVLRTGIAWEDLPQELGYGSGMTCWRRLRDWQAAGVWHRLHQGLLAELRRADRLDFSRASLDAASVAFPPGGAYTGPNPTDRGKRGSKRHVITDRHGVPLAFCVTGANRHDSVVFEELVDALPSIAGKPGRPRRWPDKLHADKAYDMDRCRDHLKRRGMTPRIARKGVERNDRLGRYRWVVERTHAWFAGMGKLRTRFERRIDIHLALLSMACCVICLRRLPEFC
ncbi:IS5 family transposase [Xanthomonas translucens pv. translucens]|uniref:IS5 family transposase n=2 Tax=Xanthomonas campestris pv. translucens TaxID=343 RepID=A0ABW9KSY8_XANCT|nr:IS5 family transposase [Xanthomonas translucens]MQS41592.1 IS5 family transposase [Xanthomonas translucens pv. translucens]QSQ29015.1 IS5 family transposase [Xanthomonas translucens pv. translucens]QSQ35040.1 IS5 family transposase [Xanthomonas translucens pv. translucens]QSQ38056.1 IS5 family transposase [Xanthomonas translucens pv. translucens]UII58833.1 IS5 family transposase [Xanthomonas translucens]